MRYSSPRSTVLSLTVVALGIGGCASVKDVAEVAGLAGQDAHPWSQALTAAVPQRLSADQADKVFVECLVVQGNGFNWAATLGWVSSQLEIAARRAAAYEQSHPGQLAAIDLRCMTGSSSGGATTAVVDHLLGNPAVTGPNRTEKPLVNPAGAFEVSKALMFLALSSDFRGEMRGLALSYVGVRLGLVDRESRGVPVARYWRGQSTPGRVLGIFAHWIQAADRYQPAWWQELIGESPYSIPTFAQGSGPLSDEDRERVDQRLQSLSRRARQIVDRELRGEGPFAYGPIGDGFCVTTMAVPLSNPTLPFSLDDQLQLVAACNDQTLAALSASQGLGDALVAAEQTSSRLALASAGQWRALLNVTVREPELLTPLSGQLLETPIDFTTFAAFDGQGFASARPTTDYLIFGGFAVPKLQAWASTGLLMERLRVLREQGIEGEGRVALFGRPVDRSDPSNSFAQRVIVDYFSAYAQSGDSAEASAVLDTFYAWEDEYCDLAERVRRDRAAPAAVEVYLVDWNITGRPAAMVGRGRELAALGYNVGGTRDAAASRVYVDAVAAPYVPAQAGRQEEVCAARAGSAQTNGVT